jgi:hypothetical protein
LCVRQGIGAGRRGDIVGDPVAEISSDLGIGVPERAGRVDNILQCRGGGYAANLIEDFRRDSLDRIEDVVA